MGISYSQAKAGLLNLVAKYFPLTTYPQDYHDYFVGVLDTYTLYANGDYTTGYEETAAMIGHAAYLEHVDMSYLGSQPEELFAQVDPVKLVNYYLPTYSAADKQTVINALTGGQESMIDILGGLGLASTSAGFPSVSMVLQKATLLDSGNSSVSLPVAHLSFPGLDLGQKEFLVSIYVAAFNRAPEYEGLKFWAGDMAKAMQAGYSERDAFFLIGDAMYDAGERNGEGGTDLPNASYVNYAYNNALGRNADTSGYDFWLKELNSGEVERGDFLTTFLTGVEDGQRDALFLNARLAVASHAAQEHVSGKGAPGIDAREILAGVVDNATALPKVTYIQDHFGLAQVSMAGVNPEIES